MTIRQQGGVFGRNPAFSNVEVENDLTVSGTGQVAGDFGLGTVPSYKLDVIDSSAVPVAIRRDGSDGDALQIFNGSIFGTKCLGFGVDGTHGVINNQYGQIQLWTSSNKIATLTINGLAMENGKGIDFSATAGTGTSELFDDYEEGTFSPTFVTDGVNFDSVTYDAITAAKYVKIGSMVHVQIMIRTDNITVGAATGTVRIGGLPFTSSNGTQADSSGELTVGQAASWAGDVPFVAEVVNNSTTARLWYRTAVNGSTTAIAIADLGTGSDSNLIRLSGSYIAA